MGSKGGRPTKYSEAKGEKICQLLAGGAFLKHAAALVELDYRTVQRWIQLGSEGRKPYDKFARQVEQARAQFVFVAQKEIRAEGADKTGGIRWLLEKLQPLEFGTRVKVHVQDELDEKLEALRATFDPETYARILEVLTGESSST